MHPGATDDDGLPTSNARICVKAGAQCFALSTGSDGSRLPLFFGLDPKSERVAIDSGGSLIFFSGTFSAGGSGMAESFALLQYDSNGEITNILPKVLITDGGDRRVGTFDRFLRCQSRHSQSKFGVREKRTTGITISSMFQRTFSMLKHADIRNGLNIRRLKNILTTTTVNLTAYWHLRNPLSLNG
jgi:hypothetical protein